MNMCRITPQEIGLADRCLEICREYGASDARVTLNKSFMDLVMLLNGELDKVTHSGDRSLILNVFADGKYGSFSTNRLEETELREFIHKAVETTRLLNPDEYRKLPDPSRTVKDALEGTELGIYDETYETMEPEKRIALALKASVFGSVQAAKVDDSEYELISEEAEYSDSVYDTYIADTNGLRCRNTETSFEIGVESTILDNEGNRYSAMYWDSQPFLKDFHPEEIGKTALKNAADQIGAKEISGGKMNMVVDTEVAGRMVAPLMKALSGFSLQQQNSFLADSLGRQMFPEGLTIVDKPRESGRNGVKMFDSEGVATKEGPIIENGVVKQYFINTYMAGKMNMEPTIEDATRICLLPYLKDETISAACDGKAGIGCRIDREYIMAKMGSGILVTGFNGGNSSSATGNFSYGVEGFVFENGKITSPVRGLVITGNFLDLWKNLVAAGNDCRDCREKIVPSLGFSSVDFA